MDELVVRVATRLAEKDLDLAIAAREMGVTPNTLRRHLDGEYVRSDSAAKYRRWLDGAPSRPDVRALPAISRQPAAARGETLPLVHRGTREPDHVPLRVVDLFSGCGGLSLGFELSGDGAEFRSVLAVDIESAMLEVLDANREHNGLPRVGRRVDLSDLTCEAEALAFYLDHLGESGQAAPELLAPMGDLPAGPFAAFKATIAALDRRMQEDWDRSRGTGSYAAAVRSIGSEAFKQTSVVSFHNGLRLPSPGTREFDPPVLWWNPSTSRDDAAVLEIPARAVQRARRRLNDEWEAALAVLRQKAEMQGSGQLASSARRIAHFLKLVDAGAYDDLRDCWVRWRSSRDALRQTFFAEALTGLRDTYSPLAADVVLGGPPCQGFSRIGRGKLRSLRESGVQAHTNDEAGDERNRLLFAYVLMVSALRPRLFLFENVRHFQAEVKTPVGVFKAPEVLAEAIADLSEGGATYGVASRVLKASNHGIPQTRERYFMAGILSSETAADDASETARRLLDLPTEAEVPLAAALDGLPTPADPKERGFVAEVVQLPQANDGDPRTRFVNWLRQSHHGAPPEKVDAHIARTPRPDDARWFSLMGPGKRWMDYRVDGSETLGSAISLISRIRQAVQDDAGLADKLGVQVEEVEALSNVIDGSLALRLLLETIEPHEGELAHHLLTPNYLRKREGQHGDWLARLPADRPCKTITSHMGKDTYGYVHPYQARTLSVREAARVQSFPDFFRLGSVSMVDGFRVIGNAVPPLLSAMLAERATTLLWAR